MFRTQVSVALKPVFFPLCPWWKNNSSDNNSMTASLFVVWAGMSQVWWKHSWEDICNVWAPGRTLHSGWLGGWGFDLVLGLWATSDRNVSQTRSSRSETYSMWRRGEQSVCERGRCAAGPQVQPEPGVQALPGSSGVSCLSFSLYAHFMLLHHRPHPLHGGKEIRLWQLTASTVS